MPFVGLGLHVLIALYFAIHALRSGQNMYWLIILFSFPLLGSIVYFVVIYLPNSRLEHGARKAVAAAAKAIDPTRELREARAAYDFTPTAQHRLRLAAALLDAGEAQEAAEHYEALFGTPIGSDPNLRMGAARARLACQNYASAIEHLNVLDQQFPQFRAEEAALLRAKCLAALGRRQEAKEVFESAVSRFGSFEIKAEYAIWALACGESEVAGRLQIDLQRSMDRWNRHTRTLNQALTQRLNAAYAATAQGSVK